LAVVDDAPHVPVLPAETLRLLAPQPGEVVVDCTVGQGGHAALLAGPLGPGGTVIGFDVDPAALQAAAERLAAAGAGFEPVRDNFVRVARRMAELGRRADVVIADLGYSSRQMGDARRGLSFAHDGPLDMRLDPDGPVTAAELVATMPEQELAHIIRRFGEEPLARKIARAVVQERAGEPITTTARLADIVVAAYGSRARSSRMHPATRTFMALRIAVNDELAALEALLGHIADGAAGAGGDGWLAPGARIGIISFHSLEDRMVKRAFAELQDRGLTETLTRRPVTAGDDEVASNPRSRSAKLRVVRLSSDA
jgi:16S rRNA (cytosine1402-N4)-methyltransferase